MRRLWYAFQDWLARRSKGKPLALPAPAGGDTRALHIEPLLMPRDRMMALRKQCRTQKTTVHGALGAAQLLALAEELHGGEAGMDRLGSAIGMRERLDPPVTDREIGMYISMVLTEHGVGPDATPWDLARDIKAQLEQRVTRGDGHLLWSSFPPASQFGDDDAGSQKLARLMQVVPIPSIVTNIGRVGPEAGEGPIKALHFTMAPQPGCALVNAVCSYRGRLVANCTFDTRLVPAEGAARVVARMGEIIEQMAG